MVAGAHRTYTYKVNVGDSSHEILDISYASHALSAQHARSTAGCLAAPYCYIQQPSICWALI
jgi:hypothetical protein